MDKLPPLEKSKELTPAIIASAPDSVTASSDIEPDNPIWQLVASLQVKVENLKAENDRLMAESDPAIVKARLLRPYANRVFCFLVMYTVLVFTIILAHGFKYHEFSLPDSVLAVLAGTSFVAIAGLIGTIISGLFSK